jgi:hypothetical protein
LGTLKEAKMGDGSRVAVCFPGFFVDFDGRFRGLEGVGGVEKDGEGGSPKELVGAAVEDEDEESFAYIRANWIVLVIIQGYRPIVRAFCPRTKISDRRHRDTIVLGERMSLTGQLALSFWARRDDGRTIIFGSSRLFSV